MLITYGPTPWKYRVIIVTPAINYINDLCEKYYGFVLQLGNVRIRAFLC